MLKAVVIALCLVQWASCQFPQFPQRFLPQALPKPVLVPVVTGGGGAGSPLGWSPYSFSYDAPGVDGSSSRSESGDAQGRVTGFYTITTAEGSRRRVSYVADENGFRATVDTNEHGTADESPADVVWRSTAPKVHGGGLTRPAGAAGAQAAFYPAGGQQQQQAFQYPFSKA
ncbi:adult-specific rigid cuticular protein 15.7-like [Rhipicephalus sanguineus]|uniref:adult-specific rigid cuticular protein 15.7-like n=1 Tax=Rhipicephalus sanguineus TaxID=34632 RepID=UPI001895CB99|nr:adult-specific rigid cuticular protein 15.7-like [Rhipicephalus sanguineus]